MITSIIFISILAVIIAIILQISIKFISKVDFVYKKSLKLTLISFFIAYAFVKVLIYILTISANADKIYTAPISGVALAILLLFILFSNAIKKAKKTLDSE